MQKLLITLALVFILAGCATPTQVASPGEPVAPNVLAVGANQTVQAAQDQLDSLNAQSTATSAALTSIANAPIIAMTQTAGEFAMQQVYAQATTTSAAATQTAFAQNQIFMAQSTTIAGQATQTAQAAQEAQRVVIEANNLKIERDRSVNQLRAVFYYGLALILMILVIMFSYVTAKRLSFSRVGTDEFGRSIPILNYIDAVVTDTERAANGTVGITTKFLAQLPAITEDRQRIVTSASQFVDLATRRRSLPKALLQSQSLLNEPEDMDEENRLETNFLLPSWDIINGWDTRSGLPYYTARGLQTFDIAKFPHLSAIGATGTGKSRRFFRPLIACALVAGYRVVIVGKSADYHPFSDHPNATLIKISSITETGQAELYAKVLEGIVTEMNRRDDVLTAARQSTWLHAGHTPTFIVLDELGNALRLMQRETSFHCRTLVEGLVSEGRKAGFNIWLANQRATGMSAILSQTGKAIFRVEADEEKAHRSLTGASTLDDGYFLAKFGGSVIAGSFEPTDDELKNYMARHPVTKLNHDEWVDGVIIDQPALSAQPNQPKLSYSPLAGQFSPPSTTEEFVMSLSGWQARALEQYQSGVDQVDIVADVFKDDDPVIGAVAVAELIERWRKVKGVAIAEPVKVNRDAEIDAQIRDLHAQNVSNTNIVYRVWDKSSAEFSERMARVKSVLSTASASEVREMPKNNPLAA